MHKYVAKFSILGWLLRIGITNHINKNKTKTKLNRHCHYNFATFERQFSSYHYAINKWSFNTLL